MKQLDDAEKEGNSGAIFDSSGNYRYVLWRFWNRDLPFMLSIGLNPSTACAMKNDPTITRESERAQRLGFGGLVKANIFAFKATDPRYMKRANDPIGPENDAWLWHEANLDNCGMMLAAWGNDGAFQDRGKAVRERIERIRPLHVLDLTDIMQPIHPLYQPYWLPPVQWSEWTPGHRERYRPAKETQAGLFG